MINRETNYNVVIYRDTITRNFDVAEVICEISVPKTIMCDWYFDHKAKVDRDLMEGFGIAEENCTIEDWLNYICTADDTEDLYEYCLDYDYIPQIVS